MKLPIAISAILLVVLLAVAGASVAPAGADSGDQPSNEPQAVEGDNPGEAVVTWAAVDHASFYRIGWISVADYHASIEAEQDWQQYFVSVSVANTGQTSHTVTGLTPGQQYWFRVGSSYRRYEEPDWSPWSNLLTMSGGPEACARDREALEALYESTNGPRWRNSFNWLSDDVPLSQWFGVSTDSDGCVLVLYLDNNNMNGELPPELGDLVNLDTLDLDGNYLYGNIPPQIGELET